MSTEIVDNQNLICPIRVRIQELMDHAYDDPAISEQDRSHHYTISALLERAVHAKFLRNPELYGITMCEIRTLVSTKMFMKVSNGLRLILMNLKLKEEEPAES